MTVRKEHGIVPFRPQGEISVFEIFRLRCACLPAGRLRSKWKNPNNQQLATNNQITKSTS